MKKRARLVSLALSLALVLCAVPAYAYSSSSLVPQIRRCQTAFADVRDTRYAEAVKTVYEAGLMDGRSAAEFDLSGELTGAQVLVITARLHSLLNGGDGQFVQPARGEAWYQPSLAYLRALYSGGAASVRGDYTGTLGYMSDTPQAPCSRYDFVCLLSSVLPESALRAVNSIAVLPDVSADEKEVLAFYNAGILTGSDQYGTFDGLRSLSRGQAAVILSRVADTAQRLRFSPKVLNLARDVLGLEPSATVVTADGYAVSAELLVYALSMNIAIQEMEAAFGCYEKYQEEWAAFMDADYNGDFSAYLLETRGIDAKAELAVRWNEPDKGGMTPAQKVLADTRTSLTQTAVLLTHAAAYSLTAPQKAAAAQAVRENSGLYYGFTASFAALMTAVDALQENISRKYAPAAAQLSAYLAENNYFYGRCLSVGYDSAGGAERYGRTREEALTLAQTARAEAVRHPGDEEYFGYLCWRYGDAPSSEPELISLDSYSSDNRAALKNLDIGSVSAVLTQEAPAYGTGCCLLFLKEDPSQNDSVLAEAGAAPAQAQLSAWAEAAAVTTSAAFDGLRVEQIAQKLDAVNALFD